MTVYQVDDETSYLDFKTAIESKEAIIVSKKDNVLDVNLNGEVIKVEVSKKFIDNLYPPPNQNKLEKYTPSQKSYKIIKSPTDIIYALSYLRKSDLVAFDTETSGLNVRKDKVIGFSWSANIGEGFYYPIYYWKDDKLVFHENYNKADAIEIIKILSTKKLIMHNASFDIRIVNSNFNIDLSEALFHDTILSEHTLNEDGPFGLKDLAIRKSRELKLDSQDIANQEQMDLSESVISNGGKWLKYNKEIWKGSLDSVGYYAVADTDITLRLFYYNDNKLSKNPNLYKFFYEDEVMPLLKEVTIPMESRGVGIDLEKLDKNIYEISKHLIEYQNLVISDIQKLPEWNNYLSDILDEEFPLKNSGAFAQMYCKTLNLDLPNTPSGSISLTNRAVVKLSDNAAKDFLLNNVWSYSDDLKFEIQYKCFVNKYENDSFINIKSKQQLGRFVFDYLGESPIGKTEKGSPKFDDNFIEHISEKYDWSRNLRIFNKLSKIKSTYFDRFKEEHEDGIWYPGFKQHGTTSGRYSSDAQQLPRPLDKDSKESDIIRKFNDSVRELLIPFDGYKFIDDDYESLEPRVFADDAGDRALVEIFEKNLDLYSVVAIMAKGIKDSSADKKAANYLKNIHPQVRQDAKAYALGIRYGMKEGKLAKSLNIEKSEAKEIINNYFKAFPNLKAKMDSYIAEAKSKGTVTSKFGRIRHLPRLKYIYESFGDDILDYYKWKSIAYKKRISIDDVRMLSKEYNNLLNNALNFPIQSAATSIVNRAAIRMSKEFRCKGINAWISLQIHDQIVAMCDDKHLNEGKAIVQDSMENTNLLAMPLIAKPEIARNLKEGH